MLLIQPSGAPGGTCNGQVPEQFEPGVLHESVVVHRLLDTGFSVGQYVGPGPLGRGVVHQLEQARWHPDLVVADGRVAWIEERTGKDEHVAIGSRGKLPDIRLDLAPDLAV